MTTAVEVECNCGTKIIRIVNLIDLLCGMSFLENLNELRWLTVTVNTGTVPESYFSLSTSF